MNLTGTSRFLVSIILAMTLLGLALAFEATASLNPGVYIGTLELLAELIAIAILFKRSPKQFWLKSFFIFLFLGDLFYTYFYFFKQIGNPDTLVTFLTTLPYGLSFLCLALTCVFGYRGRVTQFFLQPVSLIPFLLVTPILVKLASPFFSEVESRDLVFVTLESMTLFFSYLAILACTISFLCTHRSFLTTLSSGALIFLIADWAIKVEKFAGAEIGFVGFEYLWAFGVFLATAAVFTGKNPVITAEDFERRSLSLFTRRMMFAVGLISVALLSLSQSSGIELVKFISLSAAFGLLSAGLVSLFFKDQFLLFSEKIVDVLFGEKEWNHLDAGILSNEFVQPLLTAVEARLDEKKRTERAKVMLEVSQQMAHDIRSPIMALQVVSQFETDLSENSRKLIHSAVNRIREISADLSSRIDHAFSDESAESQTLLLYPIVEEMIDQKRIEYRQRAEVKIELEASLPSYRCFVHIQRKEIQRVISNLIDNAVEASRKQKVILVEVRLDCLDSHILLEIKDHGVGIDRELQKKIFEKGFSQKSGKKVSGLGLYHAKKTLEESKGSICVESETNQGASFKIYLPLSQAPSWFVDHIRLNSEQRLIILDDVESVHEVWRSRLKEQRRIHLYSEKELSKIDLRSDDTYWIDYELGRDTKSGLDVIEELGIADRAILVSSHYTENVVARATRMGVQVLPKYLSSVVEIQVLNQPSSTLH